ncbi:transcriptional antiterminator/mannitol/fructose-specific phosphotransferase system IIA component (Ntr-type) [Enterococcus sp. PF1-24]|uniref:BglG family transcription antiterminator n=1 Tax=unclassified Enterococcus TaxID=2608891 RepID=UPI002474FC52|nr:MULTISPECIES: BglG family transcription antiterminator [unclassified Enterococcus]MDH6365000.1 transcriptional antiterminator/mannitol/fructose-specific phosphotransferase system IIA component (Ntr-type) [Enterococcus sp. PFB1-1]MDH6402101.1 transcriptional antiterminator/mannitol/fructose-specific phosphotransferase system IIA component (Ntr-type) [Enterococcus sp. PF1-24]
MNERGIKILNLLIRRPEYRMTDLEDVLHLTKRQINYSIAQINETLEKKQLPKIERNKLGDFFIPVEVIQARAMGRDINSEQPDFLTDIERRELILLYLMINEENISLFHIIDLLNVSKNTALMDIKNANKYVKRYLLKISYTRRSGYYLEGEELQIRMLLNDLVQKKLKLSQSTDLLIPYLSIGKDEIIHLIRSVEKRLKINYADESFDFIVEVLSYLISRIQNNRVQETNFFKNHVQDTLEFRVIKSLLPNQWCFSQDDIEWTTLLFLSSNTYQNYLEEKTSDKKLRSFIHEMINQFQIQTFIEIEDRIKFEKRLFDHLRPACFRIRYGLKLGNMGLQDIVYDNNHVILVNLMKEIILPLEEYLGKSFPINELELLSFYFGHQLSQGNLPPAPKKRAVIVCTNGLIVSKMMMESLKTLFPELHFLAAISVREFEVFSSDYDLVFTTVPLDTFLPQYIIDPLMNYQEQVSLRYRVLKETGIAELDQLINDLFQLIAKNATIHEPEQLKNNLERFFVTNKEDGPISELQILPKLSSYIKKEYIQFIEEPLEWKEALRLACQPLLVEGAITEAYIDELIAQTNDENNYSFLGTEMAIPHAVPEAGVYSEGIGLLISKYPIEYPFGKRIHIVAPIAILDLTKHLRAINQLAELANNQQSVQELLELNNSKEIHLKIEELR